MQPNAIEVAEDLFLTPHKNINGKCMYTMEDIITILVKYGHPPPDFDGYAKITKGKGSRKMQDKKKLSAISAMIIKAMKDGDITPEELAIRAKRSISEIYRWRSAQNLTLTTIFQIEALLKIKITTLL